MKFCLREKCKKEFEPNKPKQVFCSDKCRVYFNREKKILSILDTEYKKNEPEIKKTINDMVDWNVAITKNINGVVKRVDPVSEEGQKALSDYEITIMKERKKQLEHEIANPGKPMIGAKAYISMRQSELKEIESKIIG